MTICPDFMCDALDDLADVYEPKPAPPVPASLPRAWHAACAKARYFDGVREADRDFLVAVDETSWDLGLREWSLAGEQAELLVGRTPAQVPNYGAVDGARNALRYTLHQTEVL